MEPVDDPGMEPIPLSTAGTTTRKVSQDLQILDFITSLYRLAEGGSNNITQHHNRANHGSMILQNF